jgi:predicted acyltransferase
MTALSEPSPSKIAPLPQSLAPAFRPTTRLTSIDAYRGWVMLLMMAEVLRLSEVARNTASPFWRFLAYHQTHVEYLGCSLHDLIQSSFSFLVGVALPFSLASRRARGKSTFSMTLHAAWRSILLITLGVFLRSINLPRTNFSFTDTLCQIGMGYLFLFVLAFRPPRDQWIALVAILFGYWLAFALYPIPSPPLDYAKLGIPAAWLPAHPLSGFAAHWNKYGNLSWRFDVWFLNLFPRKTPFVAGNFGSTTLSFIPTLGTMILGLIAGGILKSPRPEWAKIRWFLTAGLLTGFIGWSFGAAGICPVVKRIWTPTWTLFSGGWCFLLLAAFYLTTDLIHKRAWAFPLIVVGMNSIAAYCIAHVCEAFIKQSLLTHLGPNTFQALGRVYQPAVLGATILLVEWLILWWMYRRKLFLKI